MDIAKLEEMFSNCPCYHIQYEENNVTITLVKDKKSNSNTVGFSAKGRE